MVVVEYDEKKVGVNKDKKKIVLAHTGRYAEEYLASLSFRYAYKKIPNFLIKKDGLVLKLLEPESYSGFIGINDVDKESITIVLENLGWFEKRPLNEGYINWKGNIYKGDVFEKKWRDYFFWDKYTEKQYESLIELTKELIDKFSIESKFIGHNTKIDNINSYGGIIVRSNISTRFTDVNPSFRFNEFKKIIENGNE